MSLTTIDNNLILNSNYYTPKDFTEEPIILKLVTALYYKASIINKLNRKKYNTISNELYKVFHLNIAPGNLKYHKPNIDVCLQTFAGNDQKRWLLFDFNNCYKQIKKLYLDPIKVINGNINHVNDRTFSMVSSTSDSSSIDINNNCHDINSQNNNNTIKKVSVKLEPNNENIHSELNNISNTNNCNIDKDGTIDDAFDEDFLPPDAPMTKSDNLAEASDGKIFKPKKSVSEMLVIDNNEVAYIIKLLNQIVNGMNKLVKASKTPVKPADSEVGLTLQESVGILESAVKRNRTITRVDLSDSEVGSSTKADFINSKEYQELKNRAISNHTSNSNFNSNSISNPNSNSRRNLPLKSTNTDVSNCSNNNADDLESTQELILKDIVISDNEKEIESKYPANSNNSDIPVSPSCLNNFEVLQKEIAAKVVNEQFIADRDAKKLKRASSIVQRAASIAARSNSNLKRTASDMNSSSVPDQTLNTAASDSNITKNDIEMKVESKNFTRATSAISMKNSNNAIAAIASNNNYYSKGPIAKRPRVIKATLSRTVTRAQSKEY